MIRALVTGTLHDAPMARTSKAGTPFTTAKVRADGKDGTTVWCSLVAFGDAAELLLELEAGASLSASGAASMSVWRDKQGAAQVWLSLKADGILALKPKRRPKRATRTKSPPPASTRGEPFDDLDEWLAV